MERDSNSEQAMCRSGCGAHGNPATGGLCSRCEEAFEQNEHSSNTLSSFRVDLTEIQKALPTIPEIGVSSFLEEDWDAEIEAASKSGVAENIPGLDKKSQDNKDNKELKKKKNRCAVCHKNVRLAGIQCRCGGLFCGFHRYTDRHDCCFDFQEIGRKEIQENNPLVKGVKIRKI